MTPIPFHQPHLTGNEIAYLTAVISGKKLSGDGPFTRKCQALIEQRYGFAKAMLTTSCTDALEMTALLAGIGPGDEVILPAFTFVSTANAFALRGAKLVFADSQSNNPNMDPAAIAPLINARTRAIVVMHYAGIPCDMDAIISLAERHNLIVIEDAALALDSRYKNRPAGSLGHLAAFSFHETKNIVAGEGGMLVINDPKYLKRAEIIWEKGTNRSAFYRGEIDKYGWVDIGSSFLPSELTAAFLLAQLEAIDEIQARRVALWHRYSDGLNSLATQGHVDLPEVPDYATLNGHIFYLICKSEDQRSALIAHLKTQGIGSAFHYLSLHKSAWFSPLHDGRHLPNSDRFADCLLRLPLWFDLTDSDQDRVITAVRGFYTL